MGASYNNQGKGRPTQPVNQTGKGQPTQPVNQTGKGQTTQPVNQGGKAASQHPIVQQEAQGKGQPQTVDAGKAPYVGQLIQNSTNPPAGQPITQPLNQTGKGQPLGLQGLVQQPVLPRIPQAAPKPAPLPRAGKASPGNIRRRR